MSSSYTEFGFRISNRRFAVKIPKLRIRTPKMLMRRKYRSMPRVKQEEEPDIYLKELNTHYNNFLTVSRRESKRFSSESSGTSRSSTSSPDVQMEECDESQPANEVSNSMEIEKDANNSTSYYNEYESFQLSSTPVSFSLEHFRGERKVIILKDVSGVKIYEDIFPEDSQELASFLEESGATVYEEFDNSGPTYENINNLSSIVL